MADDGPMKVSTPSSFTLSGLERILRERAERPPSESYTAKLLAGAPALPAKKLGEEAVELVIAALGSERSALVAEAADVLYHLLVVLIAGGVTTDEVMAELARRTGQSGLDEKAGRGSR